MQEAKPGDLERLVPGGVVFPDRRDGFAGDFDLITQLVCERGRFGEAGVDEPAVGELDRDGLGADALQGAGKDEVAGNGETRMEKKRERGARQSDPA
jgi:hypothetical protein